MNDILPKHMPNSALRDRIDRTHANGSRRFLPPTIASVDFCSNDYLGLSTTGQLTVKDEFQSTAPKQSRFGSTGSRLLSGNSDAIESLEETARARHVSESALLFNSGYDANLGLFSSLPRDNVQIFYDEHVHASVKDGIALSRATAQPFRHNDLDHLERRLKRAQKETYVCIEALYSMDGQFSPLREISSLCLRYNANLVVDEAHSAGVYGDLGAGLVQKMGLESTVFARIVTYGKAFGCHGASILGPQLLKDYLINFAHSFIYTTALPRPMIQAIAKSYELISKTDARDTLNKNICYFRKELEKRGLLDQFMTSHSPIQCLVLPGSRAVVTSNLLLNAGYDVKAIRSPTVKRETERLRICLHSFNQEESIGGFIDILANLL